MFGIYIIIFEIFIIVLYGIFMRTSTATALTSLTSIESGLYFTLAYTIITLKHKMYDWSTITNYIFILAVTLQTNNLYYFFWKYCFDRNFSATSVITTDAMIVSVQCVLTIIVTTSMFIGLLNHLQIFVLCMVQIFAFCLNFSINYFGVKAVTGGGGMTIFMFGLIFGCIIKRIRFHQNNSKEITRYTTSTLKLIGLIVVIITWPSFNYMASIPDTSLGDILSTAVLADEAYLQTILCLISCIATTLGLQIFGQRLNLDNFVRSIIIAGILISSSACFIIDPFASLILGFVAPLWYFLYNRFLTIIQFDGYPIDLLITSIVAGIFSSVFSAGRNNRSPLLSNDTFKQGGLQIACLVISIAISLIFGALAGLFLKCITFFRQQTNNSDTNYWHIDGQMLPLYPDDPIFKQIHQKTIDKSLQNEFLHHTLKQSYVSAKIRQNNELGRIMKQSVINQQPPSTKRKIQGQDA